MRDEGGRHTGAEGDGPAFDTDEQSAVLCPRALRLIRWNGRCIHAIAYSGNNSTHDKLRLSPPSA